MFDTPTVVLDAVEYDGPPTTQLWTLASYEHATEVIPAVVDDRPTNELHFGHLPAWPLIDPDEAATEARHAFRATYSTDLPTLQRLLRGLQRLTP